MRRVRGMISYIVAIYNVKEYLEECIKSIISSKGKMEVILVDDGSDDGSSEICDLYAEKDSRIKVFHQENQGVSVARNKGLEYAEGTWICFVDGDDKINPNLSNGFEDSLDNEADVIIFKYTLDNEELNQNKFEIGNGRYLNREEISGLRKGILNSDMKEMSYYKHNNYQYHAPWGKFYKKEFLEACQQRFTPGVKKGQDMLFNFDVYKYANQIQIIPFIGYYYRQRPDSIGHKYNPNIIEINLRLIKEFGKRIKDEYDLELRNNFYVMVVRQFVFCMLLDCCHPANTKKYNVRKKEYLQYRTLRYFDNSLKKVQMKKLRFQVRVFAIMAKYKCFIGMNLISKVKSLADKWCTVGRKG